MQAGLGCCCMGFREGSVENGRGTGVGREAGAGGGRKRKLCEPLRGIGKCGGKGHDWMASVGFQGGDRGKGNTGGEGKAGRGVTRQNWAVHR